MRINKRQGGKSFELFRRQENLSEGAPRDAGLLDDGRQLLPELWAEHAVDDEVDGAVEDDEEPGDEVEDDGDHGHVVVLPRLVTPLHRVQRGHLVHSVDIACVDTLVSIMHLDIYLVKYKQMWCSDIQMRPRQ